MGDKEYKHSNKKSIQITMFSLVFIGLVFVWVYSTFIDSDTTDRDDIPSGTSVEAYLNDNNYHLDDKNNIVNSDGKIVPNVNDTVEDITGYNDNMYLNSEYTYTNNVCESSDTMLSMGVKSDSTDCIILNPKYSANFRVGYYINADTGDIGICGNGILGNLYDELSSVKDCLIDNSESNKGYNSSYVNDTEYGLNWTMKDLGDNSDNEISTNVDIVDTIHVRVVNLDSGEFIGQYSVSVAKAGTNYILGDIKNSEILEINKSSDLLNELKSQFELDIEDPNLFIGFTNMPSFKINGVKHITMVNKLMFNSSNLVGNSGDVVYTDNGSYPLYAITFNVSYELNEKTVNGYSTLYYKLTNNGEMYVFTPYCWDDLR